MSKSTSNSKLQGQSYASRAVSRIIVPKGTTRIRVEVGNDSVEVDSSKKARSEASSDANSTQQKKTQG